MLLPWSILSLAVLAPAVAAFLGKSGVQGQPGHFEINQVKNPGVVRNGPAEYARAHVKYGLEVPEAVARAISPASKLGVAEGDGVGEVPAWPQKYDMEYLSPVFVGEPPQLVFLNFDTGSADTWMYSTDTLPDHWEGQRRYVPADSHYSQKANGSWYIQYGDGSYASGNVYKDVMALGDIRVPNMTIETAVSVSALMMEDLNMSGLLGLCANHKSTVIPKQPTLLDLLEPILDENLFTVDLKFHDTGRYRFGKVEHTEYEGELVHVPTNQSSLYWEVKMNGLHVEGHDMWYFYEWRFIVDTGTTLLLVAPDLAEIYWSKVPTVTFDDFWGAYIFDCNAADSLPDLEFDINGFRGTVPGRYMNYQNITETRCYGGIQPIPYNSLGFGILGDVFIKAVYAVFDVGNKTIGFANKKLLT